MIAAARDRGRHEPRLVGRRATAPTGTPRYAQEIGAWALPLPTIDAQIVRRSAKALSSATAPTSATATTRRYGDCPWRWAGSPP